MSKNAESPVQFQKDEAPVDVMSSGGGVRAAFFSMQVTNLNDLRIVASMPKSLQERAMAMAEKEQMKRHEIEERTLKQEYERRLDEAEKSYRFNTDRLNAMSKSDLSGKIISGIIIICYFSLLGFSMYLENTSMLIALTAVGGVGAAIGGVVGYITNNKKN